MPLKRYHFNLTRSEFGDSSALRYGWDKLKMPSLCPCNECFTVSPALRRSKGVHSHMRYDFRDSLKNFFSGGCQDVEIEPHLQPLQGETFALKPTTNDDDDERIDIKDNGLRESRSNKTYFDVKIVNPLAKSCPESSSEAYKYHESIRRNKYDERITEFVKAKFVCLSSHVVMELDHQLQKR